MDGKFKQDGETPPSATSGPAVPPPDVFRAPPPPMVDPISKSSSAPTMQPPPENRAARVNLRVAQDGAAEEESASEIATFNSRFVGVVIDVLVGLGITIGLSGLLPDFAERFAQLVGIGYFVARDSLPFLGGQSVGKKAMKLRVSAMDGTSLVNNWRAAIIRNGVLLIPLFPLIEIFVLLTRENTSDRGRRLGDEWAKTQVTAEVPIDSK